MIHDTLNHPRVLFHMLSPVAAPRDAISVEGGTKLGLD